MAARHRAGPVGLLSPAPLYFVVVDWSAWRQSVADTGLLKGCTLLLAWCAASLSAANKPSLTPYLPAHPPQVMEDWDARSTLYRLMSGMEQLGAPGSPVATASLLSPAAALFSPQPGGTVAAGGPPSMPPGEVHMDEIDLIECIGKGGYGWVG